MNIAALLIIAGGVVFTIGDIVMKHWVDTNKLSIYLIGLGLYGIGVTFLAQSYRYEDIAAATAAMEVGNVVLLTILSYFYFSQTLSAWQLLGIFFGVVSVTILELHPR